MNNNEDEAKLALVAKLEETLKNSFEAKELNRLGYFVVIMAGTGGLAAKNSV